MDLPLAIPLFLLVGAVAFLAGEYVAGRRHAESHRAAVEAARMDRRRVAAVEKANAALARENERLARDLAATVCPRGYWGRMQERNERQ